MDDKTDCDAMSPVDPIKKTWQRYVKRKCPDCNYVPPDRRKWTYHRRIHTGEKPHACHLCEQKFAYPFGLKNHVNAVHKQIKPHECPHPGCDYRAARKSQIHKHATHVHSEERNFACEHSGCSYRGKSQHNLLIHTQFYHLKIKSKTCHLCQKSYFTTTNLRIHMRVHSKDGHDVSECVECVSTMKRKNKTPHAKHGNVDREVLASTNQDERCHDRQSSDSSLNSQLIEVHIDMQTFALL